MKKLKIVTSIIVMLIMVVIAFENRNVFASSNDEIISIVEYSEEYQQWLSLSEDEREKTLMPRMYDVEYNEQSIENPLYLANLVKSGLNSSFSLKTVLNSQNLIIKNQKQTGFCWCFATLSSLETNLALKNTNKIYDFSEKHMAYQTSQTFKDSSGNIQKNANGYNKQAGNGGNFQIAESYLTNGSGAIDESELEFDNSQDYIDISNIENKTVKTQVEDTVYFSNYNASGLSETERTNIINQIKEHIMSNGAVYTGIHSSDYVSASDRCYDNDNYAKYCNNSSHEVDHAVSIIGWDDSFNNFSELSNQPQNPGAWIVRNSWGEYYFYGEKSELKIQIYNTYTTQCNANGWSSADDITDEFLREKGYTLTEDGNAYKVYGDNGIIYVSYEDINISAQMYGIEKAEDTLNYDNIYQYDYFCPAYNIKYNSSKIMLCNVFEKSSNNVEYLNAVSIFAPETYTCKVYVNPNGSSYSQNDLQLVNLKAGESETFNTGYHTIEFAESIKIEASSFAVVIAIETKSNSATIAIESNTGENGLFSNVKTETGKCFLTIGNDLSNNKWIDIGNLSNIVASSGNKDGDSTIKAFTTTTLNDGSLKNIEITTQPDKINYIEGENFEATGMVVTANYNSKTNPSKILTSDDYGIENGNNLSEGQTGVTITYQGISVTQKISVEKNTITSLSIKTVPSKISYNEGENFDNTGMIVEATYKDGTTKEITDYVIKDGNNLKDGQTKITILYDNITVEQSISVASNPLMELYVSQAPTKVNYIVGQNFDSTGMIVKGKYQNESIQDVLDYTVENGENLQFGQTSVNIKYGDSKYSNIVATQNITVEEKNVASISINEVPSKTEYIQNKENIDLTGGKLKVTYNDNSTEVISMLAEGVTISGYDNTKIGAETIVVNYQGMSTNFEISIIEGEKANNSDLSEIQYNVESIKIYTYTNNSKKDYTIIKGEITNFTKNKTNDELTYYYYLSANGNETNITDWTKITETQSQDNKIAFSINTSKILNSDELKDNTELYLYIKEVAVKGTNQSIEISGAIKIEYNEDVIETYVDGTQKQVIQPSVNNTKTAESAVIDELPYTGLKITIITIIIVTIGISSIVYIRYRKISKYVK